MRFGESVFRETRLLEQRAYVRHGERGISTTAMADSLRASGYYNALPPPAVRDGKWRPTQQPVFFEQRYAHAHADAHGAYGIGLHLANTVPVQVCLPRCSTAAAARLSSAGAVMDATAAEAAIGECRSSRCPFCISRDPWNAPYRLCPWLPWQLIRPPHDARPAGIGTAP